MRNRTTFEWNIRTVDSHGDTVDNDFGTRLTEYTDEDLRHCLTHTPIHWDGANLQLELIASTGNEDTGLQDRGYCEVLFGELVGYFDNGRKVPGRYVDELNQTIARLGITINDFISE